MYCGCLKRKGRPSSLKRIVVVIADFRSLVDRHVKSTPNYIYKNNVSKKKRNKWEKFTPRMGFEPKSAK